MSKMTLRLWIVVVTVLAGLASPSYAQKITSFDAPGSTNTIAAAINSDGQIAGYYEAASGGIHGFLREQDGTITSIDAPGSTNTVAAAINSDGQIAGYYQDASGVTHGFLRSNCEPGDECGE